MRLLRLISAFLLTISAATAFATTWSPIYPYFQKTEGGKVKSHSIPYGVFDGGHGPGQTFVYTNGKLAYSIDKYFTTPFFTTKNGQYLIEFDFHLYYQPGFALMDSNGVVEKVPRVYDGEAVNIYHNGRLLKRIHFKELKIDTGKIRTTHLIRRFSWNYRVDDTVKDELMKRMSTHPAFIEGNNFYLITADNQLIGIEIATGEIVSRRNAYDALKNKFPRTSPLKRKYQYVDYPEKFLLPSLQDGRALAQGLAEHLNKAASDGREDSATIQIYFHTLLINNAGKCDDVFVSPSIRTDINKDFVLEYDRELRAIIEDWIKQQTFSTTTFPRGFPKYKYTDFVYLK